MTPTPSTVTVPFPAARCAGARSVAELAAVSDLPTPDALNGTVWEAAGGYRYVVVYFGTGDRWGMLAEPQPGARGHTIAALRWHDTAGDVLSLEQLTRVLGALQRVPARQLALVPLEADPPRG